MKFNDLIKTHHWLSVELTQLKLYPNQQESLEAYKKVFENLQSLKPASDDMLIVLTEYENDIEDESESEIQSTYVDVSGRKQEPEPNSITDSYAIEFVRWEKWLGMNLAPETIRHFNELEIIVHCLHEMTFCGYEQDEIQEEFDSIKKTVDDYKNLTEEEKKENTVSLDDIKRKLDDKGSR